MVSHLAELAEVFPVSKEVCVCLLSKWLTCVHVTCTRSSSSVGLVHVAAALSFRAVFRLEILENGTIIHTEAAQLENINPRKNGYTLAGVMSSFAETRTQLNPGQKGKRGLADKK